MPLWDRFKECCADADPLPVLVAQCEGVDFTAVAFVAAAVRPPALAAAVEEAFSSIRREAPATEVGGDLDAALEGPGVPVPARVLTTSVDLCSQDIVREF